MPPFHSRGRWRKGGVLCLPGWSLDQRPPPSRPAVISEASSSHTYQLLVVLKQGTGRRAGGHFVHGRNSHAGRVGANEVHLHHLHGRAGIEHSGVIAHLEGEDLGGTSKEGRSKARARPPAEGDRLRGRLDCQAKGSVPLKGEETRSSSSIHSLH